MNAPRKASVAQNESRVVCLGIKKGFTLIELLVVIAIIALLLAILMPALHTVKMKAASINCMANTKNLTLGWLMYRDDNDGRLMSATQEAVERNGNYVGWIGIPYAESVGDRGPVISPPVTDDDEFRGIKRGRLYDYVEDSIDVYHCPGDNIRRSKFDGTRIFNSYVMANCLYGAPSPGFGYWNPYIEKTQISRYGQITSPSIRYVFVESAIEKNYNSQAHFLLASPEYTGQKDRWGWGVPMAINHGDSSVLSFADGHSETHKWRDSFTRDWVFKLSDQNTGSYGFAYPPPDQTQDIEYMARGWARRPLPTD